jgi:hypothetical protein
MHKIFFTMLFTTSVDPSRFASSTITPRSYKPGLVTPVQPISSRTISLYSSTSFPVAEKRKIEK